MKSKKNLTLLALVTTLVLALAACGGGSSSPNLPPSNSGSEFENPQPPTSTPFVLENPQVEPEQKSGSDLTFLLGRNVNDATVLQFMEEDTGGCLEIVTGSRILSCSSITGDDPFIDLKVSEGGNLLDSTIEGIWAYPSYPGELPEGLTWDMTRDMVESWLVPLGPPFDNGNTTFDVEYSTSSSSYRLWITYDSSDGRMRHIYVRLVR
jgi:hypothetical protein